MCMGGWGIKRIETLMFDTMVHTLVALSEATGNHEKNLIMFMPRWV